MRSQYANTAVHDTLLDATENLLPCHNDLKGGGVAVELLRNSDDLELLLIHIRPRPLIDIRAVEGARAGNIEHFTAVPADNPVIAIAEVIDRPLIVQPSGAPTPLNHVATVRYGRTGNVHGFAAIPVQKLIIAARKLLDRPLIIRRRSSVRPLEHIRAVGRTGALNDHGFSAVTRNDLVVPIEEFTGRKQLAAMLLRHDKRPNYRPIERVRSVLCGHQGVEIRVRQKP